MNARKPSTVAEMKIRECIGAALDVFNLNSNNKRALAVAIFMSLSKVAKKPAGIYIPAGFRDYISARNTEIVGAVNSGEISTKEAAKKYGLTARQVQHLCWQAKGNKRIYR